MIIRAARAEDLDAMLGLAAAQRREYARYQPVFWRPATNASALQRPYFTALIEDEAVVSVVAADESTVVGFAIARFLPAPPVYDPGGTTCLVDDFAVTAADGWARTGTDLLHAVRDIARQRGAGQVVVVTAHEDGPKRAALRAGGLDIASEWWVGPA